MTTQLSRACLFITSRTAYLSTLSRDAGEPRKSINVAALLEFNFSVSNWHVAVMWHQRNYTFTEVFSSVWAQMQCGPLLLTGKAVKRRIVSTNWDARESVCERVCSTGHERSRESQTCVCVCVCVRERVCSTGHERSRESQTCVCVRERERERECVFNWGQGSLKPVCVCVCVIMSDVFGVCCIFQWKKNCILFSSVLKHMRGGKKQEYSNAKTLRIFVCIYQITK